MRFGNVSSHPQLYRNLTFIFLPHPNRLSCSSPCSPSSSSRLPSLHSVLSSDCRPTTKPRARGVTLSSKCNAPCVLPLYIFRREHITDHALCFVSQNSLTGSEEVAIVIGLQSCSSGPCMPPSSIMGTILYNGPFTPVYHEPYLAPYQNFTVEVPSSFETGTALIGVVHVTLIGVS